MGTRARPFYDAASSQGVLSEWQDRVTTFSDTTHKDVPGPKTERLGFCDLWPSLGLRGASPPSLLPTW